MKPDETELFARGSKLVRAAVSKVIRRLPRMESWRDDLMQEASEALVRAVVRFVYETGTPFEKFAGLVIYRATWRAAFAFGRIASGYGRGENACAFDAHELEPHAWSWFAAPDDVEKEAAGLELTATVADMLAAKRGAADARTFLACEFGDEEQLDHARLRGVTKQAVGYRMQRARLEFNRIASQLRSEAA